MESLLKIDFPPPARSAQEPISTGALRQASRQILRRPQPTPGTLQRLTLDPRGTEVRGQQARFVAIAGNIGAGKSTLTAFLRSRFGIEPFYEPNDANPYLTDFYGDMRAYAFHSQMYFLSAKFRAHLHLAQLLGQQPATVFVQDRTIYEDAEIFAKTLCTMGTMSARDFETYDRMYTAIRNSLPKPDLLIYLRCSLKGITNRIAHRGRPEEKAMDRKYLKALERAYEAWFARYDLGPTLVIETEKLDYLSHLCDQIDLVAALEALIGPKAPLVQGL